jgi:hypothetical protein
MKRFNLLLLYTITLPLLAVADDNIISSQLTETKKHPFIAGTETIFTNALFIGITGGILGFPWARPATQTIRDNFSGGLIWEDTDGFKVNQMGHPYQGSLYFNAGRANGYSFYESMIFSALGSATWETICESTAPSANDMITTTFASAPVGEMLHRLYFEAVEAGIPFPLSLLISPMDGINRIITGQARWRETPPDRTGGNMYELSFSAGGGYALVDSVEKKSGNSIFSFRGSTANIGINAVYGNPFEQHSVTPYDHFELDMLLGVDMGSYMDLRVISDGYLFSFSPLITESDKLSTGLSLHFDFVSSGEFDIYDSTIDQASNALDWTIKYQHRFQNGFTLQSRLHAGLTYFGVSDYFSPDTSDHILKNYGGGTNIKLFLDIENRTLGKLSLSAFQYCLWTYPGISALSSGTAFWLFTDVTYSKRITGHLSLGAAFSSAFEYGYFTGFPETRKWSNTVKAFIAWSL